jgi:hypothetical protein
MEPPMHPTLSRVRRRQAIARALDDFATLTGLAAIIAAIAGLAIGFAP